MNMTEKEQKMEKPSVLIAGYGIVGHNLYKKFTWAEIYDKYISDKTQPVFSEAPDKKYDFCIVSVPTPMNADGSADLAQVEEVLSEIKAEIFIIKSTVPPTTTEKLIKETGKRIVFSPEYNGNTQHDDFYRSAPRMSLKRFITFVSTADIVISIATGTAHLAQALDKCLVAVYSNFDHINLFLPIENGRTEVVVSGHARPADGITDDFSIKKVIEDTESFIRILS